MEKVWIILSDSAWFDNVEVEAVYFHEEWAKYHLERKEEENKNICESTQSDIAFIESTPNNHIKRRYYWIKELPAFDHYDQFVEHEEDKKSLV